MIDRTCFERKWITNKHRETNADPILIEKAIYAFELLGNLVENGINLIFKGGTGLMLLIPELKRLSIDIDIITEEKKIAIVGSYARVEAKQESDIDILVKFSGRKSLLDLV